MGLSFPFIAHAGKLRAESGIAGFSIRPQLGEDP
jgi:hypothetical protein